MTAPNPDLTHEELTEFGRLMLQGLTKDEALERILSQRTSINPNEYIYGTLQARAKIKVSPELDHCVRSTVHRLMSDDEHAKDPGLLLGKIQCGKTNAFVNIMALSFDRGIDICVVFTKGVNSLSTQTKERMMSDFRHFKESSDLHQKATIYISDISELHHHGFPQAQFSRRQGTKLVIICKKEAKNLHHLTQLFVKTSPHLLEKKVLIIDDEADFASRNYRKLHGEISLASISEQIDSFAKLPTYSRYLQVTATPYSLFLQPDGMIELSNGGYAQPWRPRFTSIVPVHDRYIGGQQYFVDSRDEASMYSHLFHPISEECINVLGTRNKHYTTRGTQSKKLEGLTDAVISYFIGTAIRSIQEEEQGRSYQSSALIHCDITQKLHKWQSELIESVITGVCRAICSRPQEERISDTIRRLYEDFEQSNKKARAQGLISVKLPPRTAVIKRMQQIFEHEDYRIYVVNSQNDVPNMLDDSGQLKLSCTANIFIGGSILDRGITIGKMICFFYGRDPKRFQMDTVLQHARMFGARDKEDMAVTRFHTTSAIYQVFSHMNEIDDQLRETLISREEKNGDAPLEAIFIGYDKVIKPCASQKIKVANTLVLKSHYRLFPRGFQAGYKTNIWRTIQRIDQLLKEHLKPIKKKDFATLPKSIALEIIDLIRSTYIYKEEESLPYQWNEQDMKGAIEYACSQAGEDYVYCLYRQDRNIARRRENGNFTDAPDTGSIDLTPSRQLAETIPVLMLLRQNGLEAQGWNGCPFYWPVLVLPRELTPAIFTYGTKESQLTPQREQIYERDLMKSVKERIQDEEILRLTLASQFFFDIILGYKDVECRDIIETTASRYLIADPTNNFGYKLAEGITPDQVKAGIFDQVDERFPFAIKPYRYLLFRNSRDSSGSLLLVELDEQEPYYFECDTTLDEDILLQPNFREIEQVDELRKWTICYCIKRVVATLLSPTDKKLLEAYQEELKEEDEVEAVELEEDDQEVPMPQPVPSPATSQEARLRGTRKPRFRFSMVGIEPGEYLTFVPTDIQVVVVDDDTIGYRGEDYKLSPFVAKYLPYEQRNVSGSYQGVKYFAYKGKLLADLRAEVEATQA